MITQLQKLWIFYYISTHYSSEIFRSLHYYRPGLIIMAHPVVVDDELGASLFFLRSLWLTMNNQNSERQAICFDRQQVFPMTVERYGSPPCHA